MQHIGPEWTAFIYQWNGKKSEEIMKLLGNFKGQFEKFNDLITRTQNRISDAQKAADQLRDRSTMIQKKLDKVELVSYDETEDVIASLDDAEV